MPAAERLLAVDKQTTGNLVGAAVKRSRLLSRDGLNEQVFTFAFSGLVYPQIWEDPEVDLEALQIAPGQRIMTIASGGCNALSYLVADPREIIAVDLNTSHAALNRLKIAALRNLPDYDAFFSFFGDANSKSNIELYDRYIASRLDPATRSFWNARDFRGRRRIDRFARGFYRSGLLGRFIAAGHAVARFYGKNPKVMLAARSLDEQREIYDRELKPLFDKRLVKSILNLRSSLFGLGIPPAQYDALSGGRPMHDVIEERLARLACGFPLDKNYFAWQAFNRGYASGASGPLPLYLQRENFATVRERAHRIEMRNISYTDQLRSLPASHIDRFVLLDAQDWMTDQTLAELWDEITRTARPGARVIFRTAGEDTILPGRVPEQTLRRWTYWQPESKVWTGRDRSAIYGGFHLYVLRDQAE